MLSSISRLNSIPLVSEMLQPVDLSAIIASPSTADRWPRCPGPRAGVIVEAFRGRRRRPPGRCMTCTLIQDAQGARLLDSVHRAS